MAEDVAPTTVVVKCPHGAKYARKCRKCLKARADALAWTAYDRGFQDAKNAADARLTVLEAANEKAHGLLCQAWAAWDADEESKTGKRIADAADVLARCSRLCSEPNQRRNVKWER